MTTPAQQLIQQLSQRSEERRALQMLWVTIDDHTVPSEKQFDIWLNRYPFEVVVKGIKRVGDKYATTSSMMSHDDMVRYASGAMRDTAKRGFDGRSEPEVPRG